MHGGGDAKRIVSELALEGAERKHKRHARQPSPLRLKPYIARSPWQAYTSSNGKDACGLAANGFVLGAS